MTLETKRIAKAVCKQLQALIPFTLTRRPRGDGGYTILQGYRSALTLSAGSCRRLGMSEAEVLAAVQTSMDGFMEGQSEGPSN